MKLSSVLFNTKVAFSHMILLIGGSGEILPLIVAADPPPLPRKNINEPVVVDAGSGLFGRMSSGSTTASASSYLGPKKYDWSPTHEVVSRKVQAIQTWKQLGADIDGEATGDNSGSSMALSSDGTVLAVGAYRNDGSGGADRGHVRVYKYFNNNNTWAQIGADIDGEAVEDYSGSAVSLSSDGSVLAVGAQYNDGGSSLFNRGHVRVYMYYTNNNTWSQIGADIDGESVCDYSGSALSLSNDGSVLAVGAAGNDGNGPNSGHVQVYQYHANNNTWTKRGDDIDGEAAYDLFGISVSLSSDGSVLAVGAYLNDRTPIVMDSGRVRVYQYHANSTWTQLGASIDGESTGDNSGRSVSLSSDGSVLAVGAIGNDGNGTDSGRVRVYQYHANNTWVQVGVDIVGEAAGDASGVSVSLSSDGSVLAVGAYTNDGNGIDSGHVRVYQNINNIWTQLGTDIDGEAAYDGSGTSVSLSSDGSVLAVAAYTNDGNGIDSGHIRVFSIQTTTTASPSFPPTNTPTTASPSFDPTNAPTTASPSFPPTNTPTTARPSVPPTTTPTFIPSSSPSLIPTMIVLVPTSIFTIPGSFSFQAPVSSVRSSLFQSAFLPESENIVLELSIRESVANIYDPAVISVNSVKIISSVNNSGVVGVNYQLVLKEECNNSCIYQGDKSQFISDFNTDLQDIVKKGVFISLVDKYQSDPQGPCCAACGCSLPTSTNAYTFEDIDVDSVQIESITVSPTSAPSNRPTSSKPTNKPTAKPTNTPTSKPTNTPTSNPMNKPTNNRPTAKPTNKQTAKPTNKPTAKPTNNQTTKPTNKPTAKPTNKPTSRPSNRPSRTRRPTAKLTI